MVQLLQVATTLAPGWIG